MQYPAFSYPQFYYLLAKLGQIGRYNKQIYLFFAHKMLKLNFLSKYATSNLNITYY